MVGYKLISCGCGSGHPGLILFGNITIETILNGANELALPYICYKTGDNLVAIFYYIYYTETKVFNYK